MMRGAALFLLASQALGDHACYPEHEKFCLEESDWQSCLQTKKAESSEGCQTWLTMHETCKADLSEGQCAEYKWTEEAFRCLQTWKPRAELSDECKAVIPEPEVAKEEKVELSENQKRRKAIREKAAKEARKQQKKEGKEDKEDKKAKKAEKKTKKAKKSAEKEEL